MQSLIAHKYKSTFIHVRSPILPHFVMDLAFTQQVRHLNLGNGIENMGDSIYHRFLPGHFICTSLYMA